MSQKLGSALLGAWTYFASPHAVDVCGINGLPLTPNSIRILGHFQKLKILNHNHLCSYLDVVRGKHERVMIVCEHYFDNVSQEAHKVLLSSFEKLREVAFETLSALSYIHSQGIVHRCLSPSSILLNSESHVKLSNYGLYYMTESGTCVSFPIGVPKYLAPEVLIGDPLIKNEYNSCFDLTSSSGFKSDIWSLGIILLELALSVEFWKDCSLKEIFEQMLLLIKLGSGQSIVISLARDHDIIRKLQEMPDILKNLIEACLNIDPTERPNAVELMEYPLFKNYVPCKLTRSFMKPNCFFSIDLRCQYLELIKSPQIIIDHLAERSLNEVYYLWQLAGGDVEVELRRQGLIKTKPPICTQPHLVVEEGEEFGQKKDRAFLFTGTVVILPLDQLRQRLKDVDPVMYYPLLENGFSGLSNSSCISSLKEAANLPLVIKENDIEYQLYRIVFYHRLLEGYPYKQPQAVIEAKVDIPPLYRCYVWAAILGVQGDIQSQYAAIDKETPTPTDRQIEVDIPRCHQYDELLSSPTGHSKFKRLLKAWVVSHPQYVYWQGLDSLCAPFLYLNFNNEALGYACLSVFISKYLNNFFLKDNSPVIREYLAVFSHLIAYHDPELTNHLDSIRFIPELYSIPWFLTMYTHVFPLHKIFHLWDTLLLGDSSFPLCIGVAILQLLRNNLLSFGFNECILMFSDMPDIDIQKCVQISMRIFQETPKSITFREHEKSQYESSWKAERNGKSVADCNVHPKLKKSSVPLNILKSELCPRISAEDLLELLNLLPQSSTNKCHTKTKLLVVDVRPYEDFARGSVPESINIPFQTAFTPESTLVSSPEISVLTAHKGKMIVIVGSSKNNNSANFSSQLVRLGYPKVCTLHGGIDVLRSTRVLIVRSGDS